MDAENRLTRRPFVCVLAATLLAGHAGSASAQAKQDALKPRAAKETLQKNVKVSGRVKVGVMVPSESSVEWPAELTVFLPGGSEVAEKELCLTVSAIDGQYTYRGEYVLGTGLSGPTRVLIETDQEQLPRSYPAWQLAAFAEIKDSCNERGPGYAVVSSWQEAPASRDVIVLLNSNRSDMFLVLSDKEGNSQRRWCEEIKGTHRTVFDTMCLVKADDKLSLERASVHGRKHGNKLRPQKLMIKGW